MMDFVHIGYDDRYSSKVFFSNTLPMPRPQGQGHRFKSFILKFFKSLYFPNHTFIFDMMINTGPKFYSAILTVFAHGLKVKVNKEFYIKMI